MDWPKVADHGLPVFRTEFEKLYLDVTSNSSGAYRNDARRLNLKVHQAIYNAWIAQKNKVDLYLGVVSAEEVQNLVSRLKHARFKAYAPCWLKAYTLHISW